MSCATSASGGKSPSFVPWAILPAFLVVPTPWMMAPSPDTRFELGVFTGRLLNFALSAMRDLNMRRTANHGAILPVSTLG